MEDAGLLRTQVRLVHPLQGSSGLGSASLDYHRAGTGSLPSSVQEHLELPGLGAAVLFLPQHGLAGLHRGHLHLGLLHSSFYIKLDLVASVSNRDSSLLFITNLVT